MAKKTVGSEVGKLPSEGEPENQEELQGLPQEGPQVKLQPRTELENLLMGYPSSEGYYANLHLGDPLKKGGIYLTNIDNLEVIEDYTNCVKEIAINELSEKGKNTAGDYWFRIRQRGQRGFIKDTYICSLPDLRSGTMPIPPPDKMAVDLNAIKETINSVREIIGESKPQDISKIISEAVQSGINIVKSVQQSPQPQSNNSEIVSAINTLVEAIGKKEENATNKLLEKLIDKLDTKPENKSLIEQISDIRALSEVISPSGEKPSLVIKVFEILAPKLPDIFGHIRGTFSDIKDIMTLKKGLSPQSQKRGILSQSDSVPLPLKTKIKENLNNAQETTGMPIDNSLISTIQKAINNNDEGFYTTLKELLNLQDPRVIPQLLSGELSINTFLMLVSAQGLDVMNDKTKAYLEGFINWCKASMVIVACPVCKEEYEYPSMKEWDVETDKTCGDCGVELKVKEERELVY